MPVPMYVRTVAVSRVSWSHRMPWVLQVAGVTKPAGSCASLQYFPVWALLSCAVSPGWMGVVLVGSPGRLAM